MVLKCIRATRFKCVNNSKVQIYKSMCVHVYDNIYQIYICIYECMYVFVADIHIRLNHKNNQQL